jgi:hypothetical protein
MALNWSIAECNNWEALKSDEQWPFTNQLIWATLAIDMNEITEKNATDFYARLKVIEFCNGGLVLTEQGEIPLTFKHVTDRIGLHTNAYSKNTYAKWLNRIADSYDRISKTQLQAIYFGAMFEAEEIKNSQKVGA